MSDSQSVLYVYSGKARPNSGGIDLVVRQQIQALVEAGYRVTFVSRGKFEHPSVTNISIPITPANFISSLPARYYYHAQHRFFGLVGTLVLRLGSFDSVIGWTRQSKRLFQAANKRGIPRYLNCPITHYKEQSTPERYMWPHISAEYLEAEYQCSSTLLVASEFAKSTFVAHGVPSAKITTIGRGASTSRFAPSAESRKRPFRAVFFGMVCNRKGIYQVLEAWKKASLDSAELWIIGDIPKEIAHEIKAHLPANATLFGHRNDPETLLPQCDVQILPSEQEGMAKSLIEGAACGLVTLATQETGFPVIEGINGFSITRTNTDGIALKLKQLHSDVLLLKKMSSASSKYVQDHLTWESFRVKFVQALMRNRELSP